MDRAAKFRKALRDVYSTEAGKVVLDFLKESYVDISVMDKTTEATFYRLGQKEMVQALISDATSVEQEIKIERVESSE